MVANGTQAASLISTPTLVESPFIIVKIGEYTFGNVDKRISGNNLHVTFPNYIQSLSVTKVNGEVNTYTLVLQYAIAAGDDPNMMDYVLSSVSASRKLTLSYGDWCAPGFIYREEEALITNVRSDVNFGSSVISYNISCISTSLTLGSVNFTFPARYAKPSDVIFELLSNDKYGMKTIFTGMSDKGKVLQDNLIATNDQAVQLDSKPLCNVLEYLNYLVSCMHSQADSTAIYKLVFIDDNKNEYGGAYFKVVCVGKNSNITTGLESSYEIDIGYPGNNFVSSFSIQDNEQWTILYNASTYLGVEQYSYKIDNEGTLVKSPSPSLLRSKNTLRSSADDVTWWKNVTEFPIQATMTLKGLVRPSILMTYVKLNVVFYGKKHLSSGIYVITKEQDEINSSGYKTTLQLLRIQGDSDSLPSGVYSGDKNSRWNQIKEPAANITGIGPVFGGGITRGGGAELVK